MTKLVLITACAPEIRNVRRSRFLNFQQITMPHLAARVPPGWDAIHFDEEAEEIDRNIEADIVGITFHTPSAFHAYEIAAYFRWRGICVMSVSELLDGFQYANEHFYSLQSITRRLSRSTVQLWWTLPLNLAYSYRWQRQK